MSDAVVDALCSEAVGEILSHFTRGPIRYRIAWAGGGHRRAQVWRIAREVAARQPALLNDPTQSTWQVRVHESPVRVGHGSARSVAVELEPRALVDPRFAYRVADIPAASHPTIAAALARLASRAAAEVRPLEDDVVWDPFVGSALELVERARSGPTRALIGSDIAPEALDAARANLAAAGVAAQLTCADALAHEPAGVTTVVTNPPLGRRVSRGRAVSLLVDFAARAGAILPSGGVLCWVSPASRATRDAAARAGFTLLFEQRVDMGGFDAEIQLFRRGA